MVSFCFIMVIICIPTLRDFLGWFIMIIIIKDPLKEMNIFFKLMNTNTLKSKE